jgi:PKD repeat protein
MKKISHLVIYFFSIAVFWGLTAQSQENKNPCGTTEAMEKHFQENPALRSQQQQYFERMRYELATKQGNSNRAGNKRIIPVVFHIIHQNGTENISREQCLDQIRVLNECFSLSNESFQSRTPACFKPLAADCEIEFRMATKDDQGNCTDGVVRVFSAKTNAADNSNGVKALSHWNSYKYFNIWVVKSIGRRDPAGGVTLGYAQFPLTPSVPIPGLMSTDGIVVRHDCLGSIGTALAGPYSTNNGRVAVHEAGHWLGLFHIWGDATCGNDNIDDTPIAEKANYGVCTSNFPYHTTSCNRPQPDTCGEMFVNFMDYVDGECMTMFTKGQKEVMDYILDRFGIRGNLWSDKNLEETGTRDEDIANPIKCAPIADFAIQPITTSNKRMLCAGTSVTYSNSSYNATTFSRAWDFEGGSPATSSLASPQVSYPNPGIFDVSLTVSNTEGSNTNTKPDYVRVYADVAEFASGPFAEDFNQDSDFSNWIVYDGDTLKSRWEYSPGHGYGSGNSVVMKNFSNVTGERDELISPSYNISTVPTPILMFRISGAERGAPEPVAPEPAPAPDALNLYSSNNCGQTWTLRKTWDGQELISAGQYNSEYYPASYEQWQTIYYSLSGIASQDNIRFKFEFVAGESGSNNLFIDDINIGTALGTEDMEALIGLKLYPNPVSSTTSVQFNAFTHGEIKMSIIDVLGKEVFVPFSGKIASGENLFSIDMTAFSAGLYTLRIELAGNVINKKLIKN